MASIEEDFPWLEGILDYTREWGSDLMTDVVDPLTGRLVRSALGDFNTGIPDIQAATQAATQAANTSAAGLGALAALPYGGVDRTAEALRRRTDPTNPNYNPLIPTYQAPPEAQGPLQGLATLARPVADAGPALGNLAFEATGSPALATGAHIAPEALLAAVGLNPSLRSTRIGRGEVEYDELFPDPRALPGPEAESDLFDVRGPTGRGGPGAREEGSIRITGGKDTPKETYAEFEKKSPALYPLLEYPPIDEGVDPSVVPNRGPIIPSRGTLFSSEVADVLRMTNRKEGTPEQWQREFEKRGITRDQLALSGVQQVLDEGKANVTPVKRTDITDAYTEAANRGQGGVWISGDMVEPLSKEPFVGPAPMSEEGALLNRFTTARQAATGLRAQFRDSEAWQPLRENEDAYRFVDQFMRNMVDDGSYMTRMDSGGHWRWPHENSENGMEQVREDMRANNVPEEVISEIEPVIEGLIDTMRQGASAGRARRFRENENRPAADFTPEGREIIPGPAGPGTQRNFGTLGGGYKYGGPLYSQRMALQLPDQYGQAEGIKDRTVPDSLYSHWDDIKTYSTNPDYMEGGPTTNLMHMRVDARPVLSEATWTDEEGNTRRATALNISEGQSDPSGHTGLQEDYNRMGPRRKQTEQDRERIAMLRNEIGQMELEERNIRRQLQDIPQPAGNMSAIIEEMRRDENSRQDRKKWRLEPYGKYSPGTNLRAYTPGTVAAQQMLKDATPERLHAMIRKYAGKRNHNMTRLLTQVKRDLESGTETPQSLNEQLDTAVKRGRLLDNSWGLSDKTEALEAEMRYLDKIESQIMPQDYPLADAAKSRQMMPQLGVAVQSAIDMGHEFITWSTQRGQGEAYSYSNVGADQESLDRAPRKVQAAYKDGEFIDVDTGEPVPEDQLTQEVRDALTENPITKRTLSEREVRDYNYRRLENAIDDYIRDMEMSRVENADGQLVEERNSEGDRIYIHEPTGARVTGNSAFDAGVSAYFAEYPQDLWDQQRLEETGNVSERDISDGRILGAEIVPQEWHEPATNPDAGVLGEFGGRYVPDADERYRLESQGIPVRQTIGVMDEMAVQTRGAADAYYERGQVTNNMRRFLRQLGLTPSEIKEAVTEVDIGIKDRKNYKKNWRKQNVPAIRMTDAVKNAWEERDLGGIWQYRQPTKTREELRQESYKRRNMLFDEDKK